MRREREREREREKERDRERKRKRERESMQHLTAVVQRRTHNMAIFTKKDIEAEFSAGYKGG
jgi:hypothetical protein